MANTFKKLDLVSSDRAPQPIKKKNNGKEHRDAGFVAQNGMPVLTQGGRLHTEYVGGSGTGAEAFNMTLASESIGVAENPNGVGRNSQPAALAMFEPHHH